MQDIDLEDNKALVIMDLGSGHQIPDTKFLLWHLLC